MWGLRTAVLLNKRKGGRSAAQRGGTLTQDPREGAASMNNRSSYRKAPRKSKSVD